MTVITQTHKLVNIDRFDTIELDEYENKIYAVNSKRDILLGSYDSLEKAKAVLFDLSSNIGVSKVFTM